MNSDKLLKNYVSDIDQLLQTFDQEHPEKSASQKKEITKHQRIAKLRDEIVNENDKSSTLWEGF